MKQKKQQFYRIFNKPRHGFRYKYNVFGGSHTKAFLVNGTETSVDYAVDMDDKLLVNFFKDEYKEYVGVISVLAFINKNDCSWLEGHTLNEEEFSEWKSKNFPELNQ